MVDDAPRILAGRYEVGELIGRGGMAEVHIGHDNRLGRTVAIKILRSDLARDPSFQARFRREAQSAAALNHPAIVAVYDTGEDMMQEHGGAMAHVPFIVMEYVEGHTVREILRDGNAVPIEEAVEITAGVLSALEYSHHAGIVHRDIKPANVMLTPTGAIKVMDFGIARALADSAATMTQTHSVIGTAQYLSPEQARGESVDARSDLYSTGCLLFELLTGRPPFMGDSPVSVAYQHVREMPVSPSSIAPDVPESLDRITLKALAKERTSRYGSAAEFRADLEAAIRGGAVQAPALGMVAAAAGAGAGLSGATEVFSATPSDPATSTQVAPAWGPVGGDRPPLARQDQRDQDEDDAPRHRGLIWTLVAIAVVAVAAIAAMLLLGGGEKEGDDVPMLAVPTFVGMTKEDAVAKIDAAGFTKEPVIAFEKSETVEKDLFTRSDPAEGTKLAADQQISLWFSQGADARSVPNVTGQTQDEAITALEAAGFTVKNGIQPESSATVPANSVTRTEPAADTVAPAKSEITIYVSNGMVDLPDLTGKTKDEATTILGDLGLATVMDREESEAAVDTVVRQEPLAGKVGQGSSVSLYLAIPIVIEQVQVPNSLVGNNPTAASDALLLLGLVPEIQSVTDPSRDDGQKAVDGTVARSNPGAGTPVDVGTKVILYVYDAPDESTALPGVPTPEDKDD